MVVEYATTLSWWSQQSGSGWCCARSIGVKCALDAVAAATGWPSRWLMGSIRFYYCISFFFCLTFLLLLYLYFLYLIFLCAVLTGRLNVKTQ